MTRPTLTSAITAVEIAERIIAGGTPIPRNAAQREKLQADLKDAVDRLKELKWEADFKMARVR